MDVFISWTGADRDVKDALAEKLQDAGITCWDSDKYCTSDYAEECTAAIRRCGVFIAIISDASMEKGFVQNEVTTARTLERDGLLNILVYKITDAPYTDAFEFLLNHISFVTGNMVQRKTDISGQSGIDTIVSRTKTLLKRRKEGNPEKPFDVRVPEIEGLTIGKTGYFVEGSRDESLQVMEESLQKSNVLILTEFFGFGKRSTVKKFAETRRTQYPTAIMIPNKYDSLRDFFLAGLHFTNINGKIFENLQGDALLKEKIKVLEKLSDKTLLVIPDVKFEDQPDPLLCELLGNLQCRIILLTQESADAYMDWFPVVHIGRMQDAHLTELFFHHYVRAYDEEKEALQEPLTHFFANIGGHTKTVELTAATLNRDFRVSPEDLPQYLSMQGSEGLQMKERIIRQIESVLDIETLEDDEVTALLIGAYLAVPYISEKSYQTVLEACGVRNWEMVIDLDKRRWLDVDVQNRMVSVEPLVAQIILSKFPGNYEIMNVCLDHLVDACGKMFSISSTESTLYRGLVKMEYFLTAVGLAECAKIATMFNRASFEGDRFDVRLMDEAIQQLEERYPGVTAANDEEVLSPQQMLEQNALCFIRQILPLAKLYSRDMAGLMLDFSAAGNRIMENSDSAENIQTNTAELLGISYEDCLVLLSELRQETEEMDQDSYETFVLIECFAILDGLLKRDMPTVMAGLESLFAQIEQYPQLLTNQDCTDTVFAVFQMLGRIYIGSGAYSSAILLCEKLLQYPIPQLKKAVVLNVYLTALRCSRHYTQTLFDAYEELVQIYEKNAKNVFDNRSDSQQEKKLLFLQFAEDLAKGEQIDAAMERFAQAQKVRNCFLPDPEADTAHTIVDIFIKFGQFDQAVAFINSYFSPDTMEDYLSAGNKKTQEIIRTFQLYSSAVHSEENDFAGNADPRKYVSYYQSFSRKNNSLWEQKYLSVADQALDYDFSELTDAEIASVANRLKQRAKREKMLQLAPEAFALASEAGYRILGYRHHYVQYMGAAAMADGKIAEILNGEGKTYTIVLTAFLHWLYGKQVFVVDQSPYLTGRNFNWMQGVYTLLGVQCRHIQQHTKLPGSMDGVIYTDLNTLIFGYMHYESNCDQRDAMRMDTVIVDEIDTSLVDGATQPYSIVTNRKDTKIVGIFERALELAKAVLYDETYYTYTNSTVILNSAIYPLIERKFSVSYGDVSNLEQLRQIENAVSIAILCCGYYEKGKHYHIHNAIPVLENKEKGVFEPIHVYYRYFLCKENDLDCRGTEQELSRNKEASNTIGVRDLFRKFRTVCGTTATAVSFRKEFQDIYNLEYIAVPPHQPCIRQDCQSPFYLSMRAKDLAVLKMVKEKVAVGQPILLVTQSIAESEKYDRLLKRNSIEHKLLNAKNAEEYSGMLSLAGIPGSVLVTNALAGRGADIKLGGDPELRTRRELVELGEDVSTLDSFLYHLPTPEQKASSLYQKYYSILEKNKALCSEQKQIAVDAGGLCVIGTGFFPEPRTEQQTRGRSGRQGQVGESWVFRSIEDEALGSLLSSSITDWAVASCGDMEELNSPILFRMLKKAQQSLHENRFAHIRKHNDFCSYIDTARQDFIGKRFDLIDGIISPDDLLEQWASDKFVLQNLQALQKGAPCQIPVLQQLWERYEILKIAKGSKAPLILLKVLKDELEKIFAGLEDRKSDPVIDVLCTLLMGSWKTYINLVQNTVGKVTMKEHALQRYLEDEKKQLLRQVVEKLLAVRVKRS